LRASSFPLYEVKEEEDSGERLHFVKFETKFIETCLDFIQQNLSSEPGSTDKNRALKVTGGGAFKYKDEITKKLGVRYNSRRSFINRDKYNIEIYVPMIFSVKHGSSDSRIDMLN
ncbi:pantothenate kinase 4-like, partial [Paramuricea clavata]